MITKCVVFHCFKSEECYGIALVYIHKTNEYLLFTFYFNGPFILSLFLSLSLVLAGVESAAVRDGKDSEAKGEFNKNSHTVYFINLYK